MKTVRVARLLKTTATNLVNSIRNNRIPAPPKDESGHYVWTESEINAARKALATDRRTREYRRGVASES